MVPADFLRPAAACAAERLGPDVDSGVQVQQRGGGEGGGRGGVRRLPVGARRRRDGAGAPTVRAHVPRGVHRFVVSVQCELPDVPLDRAADAAGVDGDELAGGDIGEESGRANYEEPGVNSVEFLSSKNFLLFACESCY